AAAVVPPLPSGSSPWCPVSTYTSGVRSRTGEALSDSLSHMCCLRGLRHQQLLLELD
ncbi:unnamed protein product, partial [Gulo gulo]